MEVKRGDERFVVKRTRDDGSVAFNGPFNTWLKCTREYDAWVEAARDMGYQWKDYTFERLVLRDCKDEYMAFNKHVKKNRAETERTGRLIRFYPNK